MHDAEAASEAEPFRQRVRLDGSFPCAHRVLFNTQRVAPICLFKRSLKMTDFAQQDFLVSFENPDRFHRANLADVDRWGSASPCEHRVLSATHRAALVCLFERSGEISNFAQQHVLVSFENTDRFGRANLANLDRREGASPWSGFRGYRIPAARIGVWMSFENLLSDPSGAAVSSCGRADRIDIAHPHSLSTREA
jgi:hypothetical protein